ncbi:MAG: branched-chain amino acid ABC transporter permease, partial [Actinomycetota bacterium]
MNAQKVARRRHKRGGSRRRAPRRIDAVAAILLVVLGFAVLGSQPAAAQDDETTVEGTLRSRGTGPDGGDEFFEGVRFVVTDITGAIIGEATTDAEGAWSVPLPGAGSYTVELDLDTLPEGVSLREGTEPIRTLDANSGRANPLIYPIGERAASDSGGIRAVQLAVDGIKLGLIIGITAIGLSLIFGTTGLVNFAHGEMVTVGAMVAFLLNVTGVFGTQVSLILAGIVAVIATGFGGWLLNAGIWRPLRNRGASLISMLVVSIGLSIGLRYVLLYIFGGRGRPYRDYQIQEVIDFGIFTLAPKDIVIILLSASVLVGVGLLLQRTRIGKAMRAVADNRDLAESSGIDVESVIRYVWVAGGALAGLGGVLFGLTEDIGWEMGFRLLLLMFAGVTLGGLGTA